MFFVLNSKKIDIYIGMKSYEQPIYIIYAKQIYQTKYKHKVNKKAFINGLFNAFVMVITIGVLYNVLQILI